MSEQGFKIFICEDDPWYGQVLAHHLEMNPDYKVQLFSSGKEILDALHQEPDLACIDFGLPDIDGEHLMKKILTRSPGLPVIVISGQEEIGVAVNLLKGGAKDYIVKDEHAREMLWRAVINIRENLTLKKEVEVLKEQLEGKYAFENSIIGQSAAIKNTFLLLQKAIQSNINVSLSGETGTGKEVYAKAIHFNSPRRKKPFIAVNMAAIPMDIAESELFGHEKGAFTGALHLKKGKFEEANGGTLFLDEIGEMSLNLQSKLLRVLQEREIVRVGGNNPVPVDFRLVIATHKNLAEEVRQGKFREDLYFRLIGLPIELPPLRARENDVLILAKHFVKEYASQNKCREMVFSPAAKDKLKKYPFPGNIRELKAVTDLACVMCNGEEITDTDITFHQLNQESIFSMSEKTLREYNNDIIQHFLQKNDHNVVLVAEKLDIGKSTIYNLIKSGDVKLR